MVSSIVYEIIVSLFVSLISLAQLSVSQFYPNCTKINKILLHHTKKYLNVNNYLLSPLAL